MRRLYTPVTMLVLAVGALSGATAARSEAQTTFGIVAGVNLASVNDVQVGSLQQTFDNRTGFHAGVFVDAGLGPVAIRPGLQYLNVGPLFEGATFLDPDAFQVNYVAVPVDVRLQLISMLVAPYVFTGPEFRFLTSNDAQSDFEDDLKNVVMVWSIGAGVKAGPFFPELRYTFDISGVTDQQFEVAGLTVLTDKANVGGFRLSVGLGF